MIIQYYSLLNFNGVCINYAGIVPQISIVGTKFMPFFLILHNEIFHRGLYQLTK